MNPYWNDEENGSVPAMDDPDAPIAPIKHTVVWPFDIFWWLR